MIRYLRVITVIMFVVSGCVMQQPVVLLDPSAPCEEILHPALLNVPFEEVAEGPEEAEAWILTQFPTATVEYDPSQGGGMGHIGAFSWTEGEKRFSLFLSLFTRNISQSSKQYPELGHILRCYGNPAYYTLLGDVSFGPEATGVWLELWYPDRGLRFESTTWGAGEIRRYDASSPIIGEISVMPSGTIEEMLRNWGAGREEYVQKQLALLKEWPDDFTELVVEE